MRVLFTVFFPCKPNPHRRYMQNQNRYVTHRCFGNAEDAKRFVEELCGRGVPSDKIEVMNHIGKLVSVL